MHGLESALPSSNSKLFPVPEERRGSNLFSTWESILIHHFEFPTTRLGFDWAVVFVSQNPAETKGKKSSEKKSRRDSLLWFSSQKSRISSRTEQKIWERHFVERTSVQLTTYLITLRFKGGGGKLMPALFGYGIRSAGPEM